MQTGHFPATDVGGGESKNRGRPAQFGLVWQSKIMFFTFCLHFQSKYLDSSTCIHRQSPVKHQTENIKSSNFYVLTKVPCCM